MPAQHRVAVIGLGVIGQRMLSNMPGHGRFEIVGGWDNNPAACAAAERQYPWLRTAASPEALIDDPGTDVVYIGVPPLAHRDYALAAIAAGKAVFCEKPLGIDVEDSRDLTRRMEESGLPQAVNFVFGSARGGEALRQALRAGDLGQVSGIDIRLHFAKWPRGWQEAATWLAQRQQGGFVREVFSHFYYLAERLFGPGELVSGSLGYPTAPDDAAEAQALALFDFDGLPATFAGSVGGRGPDLIEFTVWGEKRSYRLSDWYRLEVSDGDAWRSITPEVEDPRLDTYMMQLDQLAALLDGKTHSLPGFRDALSVQERVEELLGVEPLGGG